MVAAGIRNLPAQKNDETESGYIKTVKWKERLVKVEQKNAGNHVETKLTFAVYNRYLAVLNGNGFTENEMQKAYKELNFEILK